MYYKHRRRGNETGVYVACTDRSLLDTINSMLSHKGIIGISDAEGKFRYIVDGRSHSEKAMSRINEIVSTSAAVIESEVPDSLLESVLKAVLIFYDFELSLLGTCAIFEIVKRMVVYRDLYFCSMRELYTFAGDVLELSYDQIERDIRYCLRKSSFFGMGLRTTMILRILADDVTDRLKETKKATI